jgi:hypothetical protein
MGISLVIYCLYIADKLQTKVTETNLALREYNITVIKLYRINPYSLKIVFWTSPVFELNFNTMVIANGF